MLIRGDFWTLLAARPLDFSAASYSVICALKSNGRASSNIGDTPRGAALSDTSMLIAGP